MAVKRKCLHCRGDHNSKHCKVNCQPKMERPKGKLQLAVDSTNQDVCKVCGLEAHTLFSRKSGGNHPDPRVVSCPKFIVGSKSEQSQILNEVKKKIGICKSSSSYTHQSDNCTDTS